MGSELPHVLFNTKRLSSAELWFRVKKRNKFITPDKN